MRDYADTNWRWDDLPERFFVEITGEAREDGVDHAARVRLYLIIHP
jgi:hypothetical protein